MVTVHALLEVGEAPDPWCLCMFTVHALLEVGEPRILGVGAWSRCMHCPRWVKPLILGVCAWSRCMHCRGA
ncbi:hypothetical protein NDU88_000029 [Pleurodeles waltl]|uniref:Secreted protein n=1 Tax=Pleurodeles waltl TaxID=8319 RepID=A0AAV7KMZ8_PLEWA|nr:hypothetical protein NDU88_000029 [Pleurodeles waltl]